MAGATPRYGWPYPTGTDRVMDGDNAIEALAKAIETTVDADASVASWSGGGLVNTPASTNFAYYTTNGALCNVWVMWTVTGPGGGQMYTQPPVPARAPFRHYLTQIGVCRYIKQGVAMNSGICLMETDKVAFINPDGATWSGTFPYAWTAGDIIYCEYSYPTASNA